MRAAVLLLALFVPPAVQDPAEIDRWISDLGHEDIERREAAQARLLKAGPAALSALRTVIESGRFDKEPEYRGRLENVHRLVGEIIHDAKQRTSLLRLVTFEEEETTLGDALQAIKKVRKCEFESSVDLAKKVRIRGRDQSIGQVMEAIEDQLDVNFRKDRRVNPRSFAVEPGRPKRPPRVYLPGLTIEVERRPYVKEGFPREWRLHLKIEASGEAYLDRFRVHGMDGREREIETCAECGIRILLKTESKDAFRLTIEGDHVWTSAYKFDVADPAKRQEFRVGDTLLVYDFLKVKSVRSPTADHRLTPEFELGASSRSRGSLGFKSLEVMMHAKRAEHAAWCDGPNLGDRSPSIRRTFLDSIDWNLDGRLRVEDIDLVQISFSKPVREPFKVTLTIPAE